MLDTLNVSRLLGLPLPVPTLLTSHVLPIHPPLPRYLALLATHLLSPLVLTALLFLGPLYTCYLDAELPFQRHFSYAHDVVDRFTSLAGVRNFVVGPLTEELVFRSSILSLLVFAGVERARLIWATPAFFAIAHAHHAYNAFLAGGRTSSAAVRAGVSAAVQLGYTSVFGWYANFLFLRSGSVVPPAVAHVVCNVMGLPNPVDGGERHKKRKIGMFLCEGRWKSSKFTDDDISSTIVQQPSGPRTQQASRCLPASCSRSPRPPSGGPRCTGRENAATIHRIQSI